MASRWYKMQGCQMVYFYTENPNLGIFVRALERKMLIDFMPIWNLLRPFGIYVMSIENILWAFEYFSPFWYVVPYKHLIIWGHSGTRWRHPGTR
jgi:hypothetical protein